MNFLKRYKIKTKFMGSVGLVMLLFVIALFVSHNALNSIDEGFSGVLAGELQLVDLAKDIDILMLESRRAEKDFILRRDMKYPPLVEKNVEAMVAKSRNIETIAESLGRQEVGATAQAIAVNAEQYVGTLQEVVAAYAHKGLDHNSGQQGRFRDAAHDLEKVVEEVDVAGDQALYLEIRKQEKDYLLRGDDKYVVNNLAALAALDTAFGEADLPREQLRAVQTNMAEYRQAFAALVAEDQQITSLVTRMRDAVHAVEPEVDKVVKLADNLATHHLEQIHTRTDSLARTVLLISVAALVIGVILAYLISNAISRPLQSAVGVVDRVAEGDFGVDIEVDSRDETGMMLLAMQEMVANLKEKADLAIRISRNDLTHEARLASDRDVLGRALREMSDNLNQVIGDIVMVAEQIAAGAGQVADASQSLSQGAAEQAASLEQITSSMTEMASQTKTNAENAGQANTLAGQTKEVALRGNAQMQDMVTAMAEISESGQNISKIIKTIDEIAFQTNLLALNAAVEAARAGRHGKGFAVVAEEVRNLAARSAKAAKETAELIEGSVAKTNNGSEIAGRTADALEEIVTSVGKVTDLVAEIAAASNEQAEGIGQVNIGISQIDQVTQQNTANAEEGASAAEELSSQAEHLKEMMSRFQIKGQGSGRPQLPGSMQGDSQRHEAGARQLTTAAKPTESRNPADVINLDDQEFGKF